VRRQTIASEVRLTAFSRGAGCGCKLPAADLHELLAGLRVREDDRVIVGYQGADDAAVVSINPDLALVQTVDFFTPIVDDPADFGAIAAANALSDIYAMGARPLSALSIVGFPLQQLGAAVLRAILSGAIDVLDGAGVSLVGGHSIDDPEPKFGLAVSGLVDPDRILTNAGARPGDALLLTKPLGTGVIATQAKHGSVEQAALAEAVAVMRELNDAASRQALAAGAHAACDVTGFGLLGHAYGIARESGVALALHAGAVPALAGAVVLLAQASGISGGTRRNADWAAQFTSFDDGVASWQRWLLSDATTSGGLLLAIPPQRAREIDGVVIGQVLEGPAATIHVQ
jgi:selenide,water dikinase